MREPLVSVIMPVYNSEKFLDESISSVIEQTYGNWELIIVDDASTDKSILLAQKYAQGEDRIKVYKNDINLGVAATRNKAVSLAEGDWIAFLDSDDIWLPNKLQTQMSFCNGGKQKLCYSGALIIGQDSAETGKQIEVPPKITRTELLKGNDIVTSTAVVEKKILKKYPMVRDENVHEDFVLWSQILSECDQGVGVCKPLVKYRLTDGSKSRNKIKSSLMTWRSYKLMGLSCFECSRCFARYIFHGVRRYWL